MERGVPSCRNPFVCFLKLLKKIHMFPKESGHGTAVTRLGHEALLFARALEEIWRDSLQSCVKTFIKRNRQSKAIDPSCLFLVFLCNNGLWCKIWSTLCDCLMHALQLIILGRLPPPFCGLSRPAEIFFIGSRTLWNQPDLKLLLTLTLTICEELCICDAWFRVLLFVSFQFYTAHCCQYVCCPGPIPQWPKRTVESQSWIWRGLAVQLQQKLLLKTSCLELLGVLQGTTRTKSILFRYPFSIVGTFYLGGTWTSQWKSSSLAGGK